MTRQALVDRYDWLANYIHLRRGRFYLTHRIEYPLADFLASAEIDAGKSTALALHSFDKMKKIGNAPILSSSHQSEPISQPPRRGISWIRLPVAASTCLQSAEMHSSRRLCFVMITMALLPAAWALGW